MVIGTGARRRMHIGPRFVIRNPIITFAILLLVGIFFGVLAAATWQRQSAYAADGVSVQAVVVDKEAGTRLVRNRMQRYFHVTYEFAAGDQTIRNESGVDEGQYNTLAVGNTLDVLYMPDDPTMNIPAANQGMTMAYILAGAALLWNGFAVIYALRTLLTRSSRR